MKPWRGMLLAAMLTMAGAPSWAQPVSPDAAPQPTEEPIPTREAIFKRSPMQYRRLGGPGPYYPEIAERHGVRGYTVLHCALLANGRLQDCTVVDEAPKGVFFAEAALVMAQKGWLSAKPRLVDGQPVDEPRVQVVVPFQAKRHW